MNVLIENIGRILHISDNSARWKRGNKLGEWPVTENAWLKVENGCISDYGAMESKPEVNADTERIDAQGGLLLPCWVDSHTHIIYAGTREDEFAARLKGMSYEEIANKGGGILNSAKKLQASSEEELYEAAAGRLDELIKLGTGAVEIKSGYGLTPDAEIKMLRVAQKLRKNFPIPVKISFLGAHAYPKEFSQDHAAYIQLIKDEMLPVIAREQLADYVDVFCEKGYFSVSEMEDIIVEAKKYSLKLKLHVNQFNSLKAIEKAVEHDALSVDHLEVMTAEDIDILGTSDTIGTLLPGCSLFLEIPYAPARDLIDKDAIIALATDYNPGSAPGGNMNLVVSLACIKMKMTPEEAISAATINGAAAIELSDEVGSIERGKRANLILTKPGITESFIPYNFGHDQIAEVLINGKKY